MRFGADEPADGPEQFDLDAARRRIATLQRELRAVGGVAESVIAEYRELYRLSPGWRRGHDSLADLVSFGVAPAFLVHRVVLRDVFVGLGHPEWGWFIASIYVICGAFRLARFNCLAAMAGTGGGKEFLGFPIPAAAGLVASITYFILWMQEREFAAGPETRLRMPG